MIRPPSGDCDPDPETQQRLDYARAEATAEMLASRLWPPCLRPLEGRVRTVHRYHPCPWVRVVVAAGGSTGHP